MFTRALRRSATSSILAGFLTLSMAAPSQACFFNMFGYWGAPTRTYYAPFAPSYGPAYAAPGCNTCGYAPMVYSGSPCATGNCGVSNCATGNCSTGNCSTESTTYQSPNSEQSNKQPTNVDESEMEPIRSRNENGKRRSREPLDDEESTYSPDPETSRGDQNWKKNESVTPAEEGGFGAPDPGEFNPNEFNPSTEEPMEFRDDQEEFKAPMDSTPEEPAVDPNEFEADPFGDTGKPKKSEKEHMTAKVANPDAEKDEKKAEAEKEVTAAKKEAPKATSEAPVSSPEETDAKAAAKEKAKPETKSKEPQSFNTLNLDTRLSRRAPARTRTRTSKTSVFQAPQLARTKASKSRQAKPAVTGAKLVSR